VFEDALIAFKRGITFSSPIRIRFIGEPAVDARGPLREFFRLLMLAIFTNPSLFEGEDDSKVAAHNMAKLEAQVFQHIGQMIAVSIMHGGPGPQCLSHAVVDYLTYGMSKVHATISDIPDKDVKEKMALVGSVWLFGPVALNVFMYFYSWREKTAMLVFRSYWTVQTSTFAIIVESYNQENSTQC